MTGVEPTIGLGLLHGGKRYRLGIALNGLEQSAPNEFVAETLASYGFRNVQVTGNGGSRSADASWNPPANPVPIDPRIVTAIEPLD
jgi:hypothetical protein